MIPLFLMVFLISCTNQDEFLDSINTPDEIIGEDPTDDDNTDDDTSEDDNTDDDGAETGVSLAFPTAQGAGALSSGGRGGRVISVTNLNDSGSGSLREALQTSGARTIIFRIAGIINLRSPIFVRPEHSNLTIAGQSAPDGGITITGDRIILDRGFDNAIIRYIRFRGGITTRNDSFEGHGVTNVIFDHCSASFGGDEAMSIVADTGEGISDNITIQRSIFAESKTGSIIGGLNQNYEGAGDFSIHNNLWYNITHRFPNISGNGNFEVINNIVWGWVFRTTRGNGSFNLNHINNWHYYSQQNTNPGLEVNGQKYSVETGQQPSIYTSGNIYEPNIYTNVDGDNFNDLWTVFQSQDRSLERDDPLPESFRSIDQFGMLGVPIEITTAAEAYDNISNNVGANARVDEEGNVLNNLDVLDDRWIRNVRNLNYENRMSTSEYIVPAITGGAPYRDTDGDGMPDVWEELRSLDPLVADNNGNELSSNYTNLEVFLNLVDN